MQTRQRGGEQPGDTPVSVSVAAPDQEEIDDEEMMLPPDPDEPSEEERRALAERRGRRMSKAQMKGKVTLQL